MDRCCASNSRKIWPGSTPIRSRRSTASGKRSESGRSGAEFSAGEARDQVAIPFQEIVTSEVSAPDPANLPEAAVARRPGKHSPEELHPDLGDTLIAVAH